MLGQGTFFHFQNLGPVLINAFFVQPVKVCQFVVWHQQHSSVNKLLLHSYWLSGKDPGIGGEIGACCPGAAVPKANVHRPSKTP